jgi:hypothetical protein
MVNLYKNIYTCKILKLGMHVPVISISLYKKDHIYFLLIITLMI